MSTARHRSSSAASGSQASGRAQPRAGCASLAPCATHRLGRVAAVWLLSGIYLVPPDQQAVVTRSARWWRRASCPACTTRCRGPSKASTKLKVQPAAAPGDRRRRRRHRARAARSRWPRNSSPAIRTSSICGWWCSIRSACPPIICSSRVDVRRRPSARRWRPSWRAGSPSARWTPCSPPRKLAIQDDVLAAAQSASERLRRGRAALHRQHRKRDRRRPKPPTLSATWPARAPIPPAS